MDNRQSGAANANDANDANSAIHDSTSRGSATATINDNVGNNPNQKSIAPIAPLSSFLAGLAGGSASTILLYPLDLIKVRLQVDESSRAFNAHTASNAKLSPNTSHTPHTPHTPRPRTMYHTVKSILHHEGYLGLYKGLTPAVIGSALSWGGFFILYEEIKQRMVWYKTNQLMDQMNNQTDGPNQLQDRPTNQIIELANQTNEKNERHKGREGHVPDQQTMEEEGYDVSKDMHVDEEMDINTNPTTLERRLTEQITGQLTRKLTGQLTGRHRSDTDANQIQQSVQSQQSQILQPLQPLHPNLQTSRTSQNLRNLLHSQNSQTSEMSQTAVASVAPVVKLGPLEHFSASCLAGACMVLLTNPIWLIKTRLQLQNSMLEQQLSSSAVSPGVAATSTVAAASTSVSNSSNSSNSSTWKSFSSSTPHSTHSIHSIPNPKPNLNPNSKINPSTKPTKPNLTPTNPPIKPPYRGLLHAFYTIVKEEGPLALYRGSIPALLLVSHGGIQFVSYEFLKGRFMPGKSHKNTSSGKDEKDGKDGDAWKKHSGRDKGTIGDRLRDSLGYLTMGAVSKFIASTTTYPLQVIKSRLQQRSQSVDLAAYTETGQVIITQRNYSGVWDCIRKIIRKEGMGGFFKGCFTNAVRVAPSAAITFVVYELVLDGLMDVDW